MIFCAVTIATTFAAVVVVVVVLLLVIAIVTGPRQDLPKYEGRVAGKASLTLCWDPLERKGLGGADWASLS